MSKHSPGPWVLGKSPTGETTDSLAVLDARGDPVWDLGDWPTLQERANAHLIAAAPKMYAFIQEVAQGGDTPFELDAQFLLDEVRG